MANFNTHILTAAAGAGFAATLCMKAIELSVENALLLTLAGTTGGVLPDIDLKYSTPGKLLFLLLGILISATWLFANITRYTVIELWAVAIGICVIVRYPLWWLFHQFTVHRGALHSLAASAMFCFITAVAGDKLLELDPLMSWLLALFIAGGYVLHLTLDELYSVDFLGARINRSFGSALKPIDTNRLPASAAVVLLTATLWFWTPDGTTLQSAWQAMENSWVESLLPDYLRGLSVQRN